MPSKKLFLLDAFALIYRAHFAFAKNPRVTSKGLNTSAVYGFANTLLEVLQKEKPTHLAVAFDTSAPTFRHIEYPDYKAQREEQPEDITIAVPYVKRLIEAFNIPVLVRDGYEADDIIGTFAKQAARRDFEVYMMTPDKDYGQLVEDHIFLYKPAYMGNGIDILGVKEVLEKWDIQHIDQVVDMLGLQGDASDNIPGIPGIGPKTASKLLADYGSVEGIIANADQLKGKVQERVREHAELALLSKKLARIDIEVPIPFDEEALKMCEPNKEALRQLFEELEFRTMGKRILGEETVAAPASAPAKKAKPANPAQLDLFGSPAPSAPVATSVETEEEGEAEPAAPVAWKDLGNTEHRYWVVSTKERCEELAHFLGLQQEFCFDTETTALDALQAELVGLSFAYLPGEAYYVPVSDDRKEAQALLEIFREVLENEHIRKIGQNIKYDLAVLANYGVKLKGPLFDTMLASYLIEPAQRHGMDALAEAYLSYKPMPISELIGKKGKDQLTMREVPVADAAEYASEDADITLQLKRVLAPILEEKGALSLFNDIETPLIPVLEQMEREGVRIDVDFLNAYSKELEKEMLALEQVIYEEAGEQFTLNSPKQLGIILFEKLKLDDKPKKTKTGQYATNEEALAEVADKHPIVGHILDYRQLQKLKSTYIDALPKLISPIDGLIHTSYNQAVAATGRLSSTDPNLQNIPIRTDKGREIRKAFIPRSDEFILLSADYSQIELRIMAAFSKDEHMLTAFREGRDIHTATASQIFKVPLEAVDSDMRRKAKTANFGIIYGISAHGLSQRLNMPRKEAAALIEAYFAEFPAIKRYMDEVINFARQHEYVETLMGRRRYLRDINSRNFTVRGFAERNAINAPIQGSAADLIKVAMIRIHDWMKQEGLQSKMLLQVHDELVFDVHKSELELVRSKVAQLMREAIQLEVPIEVETGIGQNWLDAH